MSEEVIESRAQLRLVSYRLVAELAGLFRGMDESPQWNPLLLLAVDVESAKKSEQRERDDPFSRHCIQIAYLELVPSVHDRLEVAEPLAGHAKICRSFHAARMVQVVDFELEHTIRRSFTLPSEGACAADVDHLFGPLRVHGIVGRWSS